MNSHPVDYAPIDAPLRPIEMAVHCDDDETDGDGAIRMIAIVLMVVFATAALIIFAVP